jgi:hypothetical protein
MAFCNDGDRVRPFSGRDAAIALRFSVWVTQSASSNTAADRAAPAGLTFRSEGQLELPQEVLPLR